ncbi:SAM-dependent methyltransferase [Actinoplanes octamycinicus]|uniref:SAM-dependent methyltransferase n=1 Tax=Actinoplanes octamycinicus TaxID=135948 RepID=A0A7W7H8R2_9ACTN|nr:class I SAM-dependent methyltransferase [Actinoplanes octamycinicus]MBB4745672.1 SAM-dependent methyltransferase [Actinoplanes octamycinicus]GIE56516.1 hypothetical protein Aoc01nite_19180 [Actinoplanes octamycinicus]
MPDALFAHPRLALVYDAFDADRGDLTAYLRMVDEFGAGTVLDVGCGTGTLAGLLAARGLAVIGADPAAASLGVARRKQEAAGQEQETPRHEQETPRQEQEAARQQQQAAPQEQARQQQQAPQQEQARQQQQAPQQEQARQEQQAPRQEQAARQEQQAARQGQVTARGEREPARGKAAGSRVEWLHAGAGELPTVWGDRIPVDLALMTGNVAQVFVTEDEWVAALRGIRAVLRSGGHLIFESRRPEFRDWERWPAENVTTTLDVPGVGAVERRFTLGEVRLPLVSFRYEYRFLADGAVLTSDSTLCFRSREEIEESLAGAGFDVLEVRDAPDRPGRENVFVARAAG